MSKGKFGKRMEITGEGDQDNDRRFYLYPEINYAFHRVLHEIWDDYGFQPPDGKKKAIIVPSIFSLTRSFHWFAVDRWDASPCATEGQVNPNDIVVATREAKDQWEAFCKNVEKCHLPGIRKKSQEAAKYISDYVNSDKTIPKDEWLIAFQHLLSLYSGYHHDSKLYLDGIVLRNLEKLHKQKGSSHSTRIDYLQGTLEGEKGINHVEYRWAKLKFFFNGDDLGLPPYQCQELQEDGKVLRRLTPEEQRDIKDRPGFSVAKALTDRIFFRYVEDITKGKETFVLVIPIYDVWIGSEAWGSLCGNLLLFFGLENENDEYWKSFIGDEKTPALRDRLRDKTRILSAEFYKSGLNLLLAQPIIPPYDLIEHFLKHIQIIQDWDRVIVYRGTVPEYCYYWEKKRSEDRNDSKWQRCGYKPGTFSQSLCGQCLSWAATEATANNREFLRWEQNRDIWSEAFLPDISDEEKQKFGDIRLAFEYPITACIPGDATKRKMLGEEYIRQQLEVLRGLIPKVRARRAALRSAVSAIMGRNMSHNIGSHVLARYSSKIKDDRNKVAPDKTDHRGDFLSYLQRRMDFLAEVATSDQAFWSQPLSLREQIMRLNYGEQQKRFTKFTEGDKCNHDPSCFHHLSPQGPKEIKNNPVILSFITGKESLLASVEWGAPKKPCNHPTTQAPLECDRGYLPNQEQEDIWFACPGGEVGIHALYVILENIIRNSARHGGTSDGTVRIFVHVESDQPNSDLLKLEIIDPRTELTPVPGEKGIKGGITDGAKKQEAEAEVKELETRHTDSLFEDDKRKTLICLDKEINSILHDEPFLDASGNPNPKYWGVREMQICAHYLRNYPLSDLEGMRDNKPVLEAGVRKLENGSHCLKYTLYLQRAKLMAAVVKEDSADKDRASALRQKGILVEESGNEGKPEWKQIAPKVRGYSFLVVEEGITFPDDKSECALLPVRTFKLPTGVIKERIDAALDNRSKGITWMEPLHEGERGRYQEKRSKWWGTTYWGLDAREDCNSESMTGIWRKVKLDTNQKDSRRNDRPMWPLADHCESMVKDLADTRIAALWVDHAKPDIFTPPNTGAGSLTRLYQAGKVPTNNLEPIRRWIHVEALFHDSPHKEALDVANENLCQELLSAALSRVAILDERVQSAAETKIRNIELKNIWPSMGVWVPKKQECNLDAPQEADLKQFLACPTLLTEHYPIDFLIVHLTILERLHKDRKNKSDIFAQTLCNLTNNTQAACAEVIVVTGRGVPTVTRSDAPDYLQNVRYLPISAILEYLVARPSKLALMRVLWNAGRPANHESSA